MGEARPEHLKIENHCHLYGYEDEEIVSERKTAILIGATQVRFFQKMGFSVGH